MVILRQNLATSFRFRFGIITVNSDVYSVPLNFLPKRFCFLNTTTLVCLGLFEAYTLGS